MNLQKYILLVPGLLALAVAAGCGKHRQRLEVSLADLETTNAPVNAAFTRLDARSGSTVRIEGTSTLHDWHVESPTVGGFLEVGPGFPLAPGQAAAPGRVEAHAQAVIPARGLKSVEKDGKRYSDAMDDIMYEKLKAEEHPNILFYLNELTLKEPAKSPDAAHLFEASGDLVVAGVTNRIAMPVTIVSVGEKKLRISGSVAVKMTQFGIDPPQPKILVLIKTGDEVKLSFEWIVAQKTPPVAPAASPPTPAPPGK